MEVEIRLFGTEDIPFGGEMISETWALICEIGLWGWIGAAMGLILNSFPIRGEFNKRPAIIWGGSLVLFYALWIVGMANA